MSGCMSLQLPVRPELGSTSLPARPALHDSDAGPVRGDAHVPHFKVGEAVQCGGADGRQRAAPRVWSGDRHCRWHYCWWLAQVRCPSTPGALSADSGALLHSARGLGQRPETQGTSHRGALSGAGARVQLRRAVPPRKRCPLGAADVRARASRARARKASASRRYYRDCVCVARRSDIARCSPGCRALYRAPWRARQSAPFCLVAAGYQDGYS